MEFRLLGPFEVVVDGRPVGLGGRQRRTLLAVLVVHHRESVSTDRLIDELWGDAPPAGARKSVQAHVAHLRRALNSKGEVLMAADEGYMVDIDPDSIDSHRFEKLFHEGQTLSATSPEESATILTEAVAMFRGSPLAGLADDAFSLRIEASRLEEMRLEAMEGRLDALLGAGETGTVIVEAERLVAEHPLRERLWAILMTALHGSGRQAEALRAYSRLRQILAEELGIEPAAALQQLEKRILDGAADVAPPSIGSAAVSLITRRVVRNPYKGLRAFDEADSSDFFGRETLVRRLQDRIETRRSSRVTVLVGPSGAGKSSVVRAGLVPALREREIPVGVMFPGDDPIGALGQAIGEATGGPLVGTGAVMEAGTRADSPVVIVVDQCEELFISTSGQDLAHQFLDLVSDDDEAISWVMTIRADFLDRLLSHPRFSPLLEEALVLIPFLDDDDIRAVITGPARRVGLDVDPEVVAAVIADVRNRPTALPLLQFALTDTFVRRRGDSLTLGDYERAGGISGALARRAEEVFASLEERLGDDVRRLLLQLVAVTDEAEVARRRVPRDDLVGDEATVAMVLDRFGAQRLITFDQDIMTGSGTVEVAHEALISEWPRFSRWVEDAFDDLRMARRLAGAVTEWERSGHDPSFLLTGARLNEMEAWIGSSHIEIPPSRTELVTASRAAEESGERSASRRRQVVLSTVSVAAVVAMGMAVFAFDQAGEARDQAAVASARELVAASAAALEHDPELGALLALEAIATTQSHDGTVLPDAEEALHRAVQSDRLLLQAPGSGGATFSPDGGRFSGGGPDEVPIMDTESREVLLSLVGHTAPVSNVIWSIDGRLIGTNSEDGSTRIWDATDGEELRVFEDAVDQPLSIAFSHDSRLVATSHSDRVLVRDVADGTTVLVIDVADPAGVNFGPGDLLAITGSSPQETPEFEGFVQVWDVAGQEAVVDLPTERRGATDVVFSRDGSLLVVGDDPTVRVYETATWDLVHRLPGHNDAVQAVDVDPAGRLIASGSNDGTARVFDASTGDLMLVTGAHRGSVLNVAFNHDGSILATGSADDAIRLWDTTLTGEAELLAFSAPATDLAFDPSGSRIAAAAIGGGVWDSETGEQSVAVDGHTDLIRRIQFSPDGELLLTASFDGRAGLWRAADGENIRMLQHASGVGSADFSPDGALVATATDVVTVWDLTTDEMVATWPVPSQGPTDIEFSPDGARLATAGWDGVLKLWDAGTWELVWEGVGHQNSIIQLEFSDDGTMLATAGWDGVVKVWSVENGDEVWNLEGHVGEVWAVDFSPDGDLLASSGSDGATKLWNLSSGTELMTVSVVPVTVFGVDFSPDGRRLATASFGDRVRVYALAIDELIGLAQFKLSRGLTDAECRTYLHTAGCGDG